ncbi:MAG: DUF3301 domain-containing protein [Arenicellales bacterium]|nr:DUF3301 domain-containing protein [Arenicellales bacterium]
MELSLLNVILIAVFVAVVWYFFDAMRAREIATAVAREYCKQSHIQFLDGTVGLRNVTISMDRGKPSLKRRYEFHYSESDHTRNIGLVIINGNRVEHFILQHQTAVPSDTTLEA